MVFRSRLSWLKGNQVSQGHRKFRRTLQAEQLESRRLMVANVADIINIASDTSQVASSAAGRNEGMAQVGNLLYFVANDATNGNEVRWIDTTLTNPPVHTIDLNVGAGNSIPIQSGSPEKFSNKFFLVDGSRIYFAAEDAAHGDELRWIDTDVKPDLVNTIELNASSVGSNVDTTAGYAVLGGKLFYSAKDSAGHGQELEWLPVPAINTSTTTAVVIPNTSVTTININTHLSGTSIDSAPGEGSFGGFIAVGDYLYFEADDGDHGGELHYVDASSSTPASVLIDMATDSTPSNPGGNNSGIFVEGHKLFYNAYATTVGNSLYWIDTDVDPSGWHPINLDSSGKLLTGGAYLSEIALYVQQVSGVEHDYLFFDVDASQYGGVNKGIELGYIDVGPTASTPYTITLVDINLSGGSVGSSFPGRYGGFASIGNYLYFMADDGAGVPGTSPAVNPNFKLRQLDMTTLGASTPTITPINVTPDFGTMSNTNPTNAHLTVDGDRLFMSGDVDDAQDGTLDYGQELVWIDSTDTSDTGAYAGSPVPHVIDINSGTSSSNPGKFGNFAIANGNLYFPVESSLDGDELGRLFIGIPPKVDSIVFGDGTAQRSMVKSITVTFSEDVTIDSGAFVLQSRVGTTLTSYSASQLTINVSTALVSGKTVATLAFSGSTVIGGSLADGNWELTILADHIRDADHQYLDGDSNGTGGDDYVKGAEASDNFFRYFGDLDGNRAVTPVDFLHFLHANGTSSSSPNYIAAFDYNSDGAIAPLDEGHFLQHNGTGLPG